MPKARRGARSDGCVGWQQNTSRRWSGRPSSDGAMAVERGSRVSSRRCVCDRTQPWRLRARSTGASGDLGVEGWPWLRILSRAEPSRAPRYARGLTGPHRAGSVPGPKRTLPDLPLAAAGRRSCYGPRPARRVPFRALTPAAAGRAAFLHEPMTVHGEAREGAGRARPFTAGPGGSGAASPKCLLPVPAVCRGGRRACAAGLARLSSVSIGRSGHA